MSYTGTVTATLSALDTGNSSYNWDRDVENAYKGAGDTSTYAIFVLNTGSGATSNVYISFGDLNIPALHLSDPTFKITSATMELTCRVSAGTSYISSRYCGGYEDRFGTIFTLTSSKTMSTTADTYTFDLGTDYVKSELNQFVARFWATRGSTNPTNNYYIAVYGGTLTVQYEVNLKANVISITNDTSATVNLINSYDYESVLDGADLILEAQDDLSAIDVFESIPLNTDITGRFRPTFAIYSYPTAATYTGTRYSPGYFTDAVDRSGDHIGSANVDTSNTSADLSTHYVEYSFDFSSIPLNAIIDSISLKIAYLTYQSSPGTYGTLNCQLYSGSTAKGAMFGLTAGPDAGMIELDSLIESTSLGTWTRAELQNAKFRFSVGLCGRIYGITWTANCKNNSNYRYYQVFSITQPYNIQFETAVTYLITLSNSTSATASVNPTVVKEGKSSTALASTVTGIVITDNGTNVTNQFSSLSNMSATPSSYSIVEGTITGTRYQNAIGKGSDATPPSGNDYSSDSSSVAIIRYDFDFSWLPSNVTINSVTLNVVGHKETTAYTSQTNYAEVQAYSYDVAKGSATEFTMSDAVHQMNIGSWTRDELLGANLRFKIGYYGGVFGGATWSVTTNEGGYYYVISNVTGDHAIVIRYPAALYFKSNGAWVEAAEAYKKINGVWVEQSDLTTVFNASANYVLGQP